MRHLTRMSRNLSRWRGGFTYLYLSLMLLCFCAIGVKAADTNGSVKFNSGVRYSQWAINSRAHDFYANTTKCGMATIKDGNVSESSFGKSTLDYVPGLVAKSMIEAADYYQGFDWSKPWFLSVKEYGDKYYGSVEDKGGSLDNLNAVKLYIGLFNNINATETDKSNAKTAIGSAQAGLVAHNKSNSIQAGTLAEKAGNTVLGGWFHKTPYNNQMWLDGAYMGSALLAQIVNFNGTGSNVFGSTTADWDMVTKQLNIVWNMCWNSTDKLMYHAFEANAGTGTSKSHADTWAGLNGTTKPYTFHSAAYWGRANAWYLMALVDVLEAMKNAGQENTTNYTTLKQHLADLAAGIAARQDATTGGWYQVMDDPSFKATSYNGKSSTATNYIETSATAIFAAAYFKAVRCGLLESTTQYDYKTIAKNAFEGLVNNYTYLDNNGDMQIWGSCRSAGLGGDKDTALKGAEKYRDGSKEYYLLGNDVPMVSKIEGKTEGKVLGGFIMAATEYERAYQNQDSKQILFAKDLAPNYDFTTTTAGTLDATAYGNGNVSYQWYKDGAAIANAKSATYTPTENGSYYCIATANGNTITTSATNVTTKSNSNTDNGSTDNNGGSDNGTTTGNIFSYTIKTTEKDANTPYKAEGGTVTLGAAKVDVNGFKSDGNLGTSKYILVSLNNNTLQEGDVIKISAYSESAGKGGLVACKDNTKGASSVSLGNMTKQNEDITYTITASDILNGLCTFYLYRNGTTTYIKSISITRAAKKYTVSATAKEGGSVSIKNGSSEVTSGTEVEANTSLTFTATPSEGYEFVNWTDASNTEVSTNATYTTTVTAAIALTANFKAKTTVDPTESGVIYDFTGSIGTTTDGTNCTTANKVITFSSNFSANEGKYITIKPKTGGFKAGDVITLEGYCDSKNLSGVIIYSDVNGSSIFKSNVLAKSADDGSKFTYTIEKDCDALYLGRYGGGTTRLTSLKVERPASSSNKTRLTASFERNADVVVNTTTTVTLPTLTVKAGGATLTADKYTVVYKSNAEKVATLSGNTITINSLGIATITATVTPTDANTYEGTTATYQLSVKAPSPLNVSVMDVTINTTDAEEEQPVIKVYGDKDELLKLGQDYTLSYTVSGDNVTVDETTGKFLVKKNAENTAFIKGTSLITVTATPTTSLGSNYIEGKLQFSYSVSEGKIKPVFLESFKDITINLQPGKSKTIAVPLIYNGEDVSSYFTYTYTIDPAISGLTVDGSKLTFTTPNATRTYTVKVNADAATIGDVNYGDVYDKPAEISFTLNVDSKYEPIIVTPDPTSIKMFAGTTLVAPDLTVKVGTTTLDDTKYTVSWFSTSPGVVKVDAKTGKIETVSEGTAKIRVVVTGENLESTTALITVEVDDRALYRVKGPESDETYGNQKRMWNQDNTLSVVLGGWMFPNDGIPDSNILDQTAKNPEKLSKGKGYQWDKTSSPVKWKLTGFDYYVTCNNNKNARQENGSNALPETTNIYSADFVKYKGTIKDNMFNVPCSGSYLEFNPVTNGKVTVHIFQNGAFDAKTTTKNGTEIKEYQYRPQRRVFVMDEAGNFVESTAHIESTNGKPTGGIQTIDKYKWDLDSKTLTIEDVRHHFNGIPTTFDMTADAFKNNVYESLLDTKKVPNAAANDRKGSHGWSVLADSPVTYTFNVKAGKTYYLYNFGSKIGFYGFSFDETKPIVDEVSYADNQSNTITATAAGHVAKVTVNRSIMKKDVWTTCVLPFSLNRQQVDAIFGPAYSAAYPQGTQILYFDRVEGNKVFFVRHAYNTIVAGKPFLIKPTKDVTSINTAEVTDYPYVTIENTEPADWCTGNGYTWASSYSNNMTVKEGDGFISKDGSFKNFVGPSGTLKGFRGYLKHLGTQTGAKPMMLKVVSSSNVDGDNGETTGIEDLIIDVDGQLMPANGKVYNINGQLVSEDANSFQSLPSGIYIINGKKYIK
ncbi:glycoside hydrolase family 88 protein [Segatella hominis]|uniref:glycoside hydrolase family 88 protein n=1 Tax=Segatella hominis TaxID=2518605 RepID=UPI003AB97834